jgi:two-component system, chemotaxis family, protein-glutamate methylesterase/glutaminase
MRKILSDIVNSDPMLEVCGIARDGKDAIDKSKQLKPDLITMDIEMPIMDGISASREILKIYQVPIIVVSALSEQGGKRTVEAMDNGALDFILKPQSISDPVLMEKFKKELNEKIITVANAQVIKFKKTQLIARSFNPTTKKILLIGSSTGGPQTLEAFLTELPKNLPAPILIVQHMPPIFTKSLADRLTRVCQIQVKEAKDGDTLQNGQAYIAPGDYHMELKPDYPGHEGTIRLNQLPKEQGVRPCVNRLFKSVAPIFKDNVIGVILTGMGSDGTEGSKEVKNYNGTIIAQSEATSIIYGMPKSVVEAGFADAIVDLDKMAVAVLQLIEI